LYVYHLVLFAALKSAQLESSAYRIKLASSGKKNSIICSVC